MKNIKIAFIIIILFALGMSAFSAEPKFIRDYSINNGYRFYSDSEYLEGNYRSNFISIPMNRMLNHMDGFEWKVGVFELEGNTLFVGYSEDGSGALQLCDENKKMWISKVSYKEREESYFKYQGGGSGGLITQIELKGKKYTLAIAGISSNKAGIYSDIDGFRMWVENEPSKDTALSKIFNGELNYEYVDIHEGIYKPGWKRLWGNDGRIDETGELIYKYSYKDFEFLANYNQNAAESLLNLDGSLVKLSNFSEPFRIYMTDKDGKVKSGSGIGFEADAQLGSNKVRIAVISCLGKFIYVKDTTGYPVIQTKTAAPANKAKKAGKSKKSAKAGKSAQFIRDSNKWARVYSRSDIEKGLYKSNYKNIPQSDSKELTSTVTSKDGQKSEVKVKSGIFDLGKDKIMIHTIPGFGWLIAPVDNADKKDLLGLNYKKTFTVENTDISGQEADVKKNNEVVYTVAMVALDAEKGDYRLFVKNGPDEETAMNEKDVFGIEYYNCVDIQSGIYKPGFEKLKLSIANDDAQKAHFENVTDDNPVFVVDYQGFKFLVGPDQDPANYVKNLDGSVIHNPETQIRYMLYNSKGETNCQQGASYGWEGKVKLGEKEVTLAVFKWNYAVNVFVKE